MTRLHIAPLPRPIRRAARDPAVICIVVGIVLMLMGFVGTAFASTRHDIYERGIKVQTVRCNNYRCDVYERGLKVRTIRKGKP